MRPRVPIAVGEPEVAGVTEATSSVPLDDATRRRAVVKSLEPFESNESGRIESATSDANANAEIARGHFPLPKHSHDLQGTVSFVEFTIFHHMNL